MVPLGETHTEKVKVRFWMHFQRRAKRGPTLLELELLDTGLIGGDGGTLDTNTILLDGLSRVNGDLVVGLVTVFKTLGRGQPVLFLTHPPGGILPSRSTSGRCQGRARSSTITRCVS